jgi:hypothetical protein
LASNNLKVGLRTPLPGVERPVFKLRLSQATT